MDISDPRITGSGNTLPSLEALFHKRKSFIKKYCSERGWNIDDLSIEQIMEIRKQDGWKRPEVH